MRVLITGGSGFIGQHLASRFLDDSHAVHLVDNWETSSPRIQEIHSNLLDVSDRGLFYAIANQIKPELVIHCAASYKDPEKWHRDVDTNITGTINALLVAKHHNAKLVYFQTALPPVSSYAISKIAAEHYINISDVPHLIFRLANVYGPRNISGPIPTFYKRLAAGETCTVVHSSRDMVYIDDLVECVMRALNKDKVGTFDVCSGELTPILALYKAVAAHFPDAPEPQKIAPPNGDVPTSVSVNARLPGWSAVTPLVEGIAEAVKWYRENGVAETYSHLKVA